MSYTKEELHEILEKDFMEEPNAFGPGRTNDDMVDSMCICFALDEDWDQFYTDWLAVHIEIINGEEYIHGLKLQGRFGEDARIQEHHERVDKWLYNKWICNHYNRGEDAIMTFAINY